MNKLSFAFALLLVGSSASAYELGVNTNLSPYDVIAPGLNGEPGATDRQVGQIFLDVSSGTGGTLKVVGSNGSIQTLSIGTGGPISSGTTGERVERISFGGASEASPCTGSCTIYRQSGTWVSSVTRNATGDYTLAIVASTFSARPTCTYVNADNDLNIISSNSNGNSATSLNIKSWNMSSGASDAAIDVICMGPR